MRRATFAPSFIVVALTVAVACGSSGLPARGQINPPAPQSANTPPPPLSTPPPPPVPRPAASTTSETRAPGADATPATATPAQSQPSAAGPGAPPNGTVPPGVNPAVSAPPTASPEPGVTPIGTAPPYGTVPAPTQPPIIVEPPAAGVQPGATVFVRVNAALGTIVATVADPAIAQAIPDQNARTVAIVGRALGTTTVTIKDDRGVSRDVAVRVAYNAGTVADTTSIRITGDPATPQFVREQAAAAAIRAATLRGGASANATAEQIAFTRTIATDDLATIDVPVIISGDGYFTVTGTTHVTVENYALPRIQPSRLLVSDYPETLHESGVLFAADLDRKDAQRFLYYHYNPGDQPARRIVLHVQNPSSAPALVQTISGSAGPEQNEMEVGHLSTQRFLVHELQNEGTVQTIAPNATLDLVDHALPPRSIVSAVLQLREIEGNPLKLTLVAENAASAPPAAAANAALLTGGALHARGVYPVPEFFFDYTFPVDGPNLEIPIGQLPLPNLRQGEALGGDYGVQQSITVRLINATRAPAPVALYANPRGGKATGTFIIDRTLVQAHALAPFSRWKIWQAQIAPHTFRTVQIITMPEGGSSYPMRLIFAPDDGSTAPGAPGSPLY